MALRELYSNGRNSAVYVASSKDRQYFPQAEVVRAEVTKDKWWFARLFYKYKIASLLFPKNVIDVVAATVNPAETAVWGKNNPDKFSVKQDRENLLFSRIAKTIPGHEIYASHMTVVGGDKVSLCTCGDCGAHREKHGPLEVARATVLTDLAIPMGMGFPYDDPSDYCLVDGDILFFEIQHLDSLRLRKYLEGLSDPTVDRNRVLSLLDRYDSLWQMSKSERKSGRSALISA